MKRRQPDKRATGVTTQALFNSEVHERVGRNLLAFQQIELMLKSVAPFLVKQGGGNHTARVRAIRKRLKAAPFGSILDLLAESAEMISPQFREEMRATAKSRNELVHRLIVLPEAALLKSDHQAAIAYLDQQLAAAMRFAQAVWPMYESVQQALEKGESVRFRVELVDEA